MQLELQTRSWKNEEDETRENARSTNEPACASDGKTNGCSIETAIDRYEEADSRTRTQNLEWNCLLAHVAVGLLRLK
jgi:hypothetical protein